jgi:hypothetical protein
MKVLLLHPNDTFDDRRWSSQSWDRIVDLGVSSAERSARWAEKLDCDVLHLHSFRRRDRDFARVKEILNAACGRLIDTQGLDWWRILSILLHEQLEMVLLINRLSETLSASDEVYASRWEWPVQAVAHASGHEVRPLRDAVSPRLASRLPRYGRAIRRLSFSQIKDVLFDKYDAHYRWRSHLQRQFSRQSEPVVIVPTAYTNVSRMGASYARMLPEQRFLFVATRYSALAFDRPPNVTVVNLAAFAEKPTSDLEADALLAKWEIVKDELRAIPEVEALYSTGSLDRFAPLLRQGIAVRDAWARALSITSATAVLCGDDSNPITRIAVDLAAEKGVRTVDFHHGALDGRFLFKSLPSDVYLAKSEMEKDYLVRACGLDDTRVAVGAPHRSQMLRNREPVECKEIVFFSEPYENNGARPTEVYTEIIPPLVDLCRSAGTRLVIKLHPFESKSERRRVLRKLLSAQDLDLVDLLTGPMPEDLASHTWFGVTVESTAALDCAFQGVPCFLCSWLEVSPYGYVQQYSRFGIGQSLRSANEIRTIPRILSQLPEEATVSEALWKPISPETLRRYLEGEAAEKSTSPEPAHFGMSA